MKKISYKVSVIILFILNVFFDIMAHENQISNFKDTVSAKVIDSLINDLRSYNTDIRSKAAEELTKIGEPTIESVVRFIKEENAIAISAYDECLVAVSENQPEKAQNLKQQAEIHDNIILFAFTILWDIGSPAVPSLLDLLNNEVRLRRTTLKILGNIGDKRSLEPIINLLNDQDDKVRLDAVAALQKISGYNFGEDKARWKKWLEKNKSRK